MKKAVFNWSGGKDSSIALYSILNNKEYQVDALLTSINQHYQRVSMHGVRVELLEEQVKRLNIPLKKLEVAEMPTMDEYNTLMRNALIDFKEQGIEHVIYGDIFLEDLRKYREEQIAKIGMLSVFPIWKQPTDQLVRKFLNDGFKSVIVCINDKFLDRSFVGREIDDDFIKDLPSTVDPCGENGEFHSFVYDGPLFSSPIAIEKGEIVYKEYKPCAKEKSNPPQNLKNESDSSYASHDEVFENGFWYCDLRLKTQENIKV